VKTNIRESGRSQQQFPARKARAVIEVDGDGNLRIIPTVECDSDIDRILNAMRREFAIWPLD